MDYTTVYWYEVGYEKGFEESKPRWFDVKENLPQDDGNYLVFTSDNNSVEIATYYGDGEWLTPDLTNLTSLVTHWMTLPKLPEEDT